MRKTIRGTATSRNSNRPPSETEIIKLNPGREEVLKKLMSWPSLAPGTLNVSCNQRYVERLGRFQPSYVETGTVYPEKYKHIPAKRGEYWYYKGSLQNGSSEKIPIIIRRAKNPVKGRVEVYQEKNLRETKGIIDGQKLKLTITEPPRTVGTVPLKTAKGRDATFLAGQFLGAHAFLICSGPSFSAVDRGPLKFCFTMAVNNSVRACTPKFRPSAWTCADGPDKFLYTTWADPQTMKFVPDCNRDKPLWCSDTAAPFGRTVSQCPNVWTFPRNNEFNPETYLIEPSVNWGSHKRHKEENGKTGCRSVMLQAVKLLYVLGFRHIYLLGADFKMSADCKYSFPQDRKSSAISGNNKTYQQLNWRFERLGPHFAKHGLHLYNCNPDSGLTSLPMMPYQDALAAALDFAPDWKKYTHGRIETTEGLYETKWYVCPQCAHDQRVSKEQVKEPNVTLCVKCSRTITEGDRKKYCKDKDQIGLDS